jgi:hypothetical protein
VGEEDGLGEAVGAPEGEGEGVTVVVGVGAGVGLIAIRHLMEATKASSVPSALFSDC